MDDGDKSIWRYMNFLHFVSMMEAHSLYFTRPCQFDDPWDGHCPPAYIKNAKPYYDSQAELEEDFSIRFKRRRYGYFLNCWQQSDQECLAMWKLYGAWPEGVAIQSTIDHAVASLHPNAWGKVEYYNPSDNIRHKNIVGPDDILYKRNYFEFEKEFRMWVHDDETLEALGREKPVFDVTSLSKGKQQSIDNIERLIHRIVVAPGASDELLETVKAVCVKAGKVWLSERVERSSYDLPPSAFS
jgi:hypothetical protein